MNQTQFDGSVRSILHISRATLTNEANWSPLELEGGVITWAIDPFGTGLPLTQGQPCISGIIHNKAPSDLPKHGEAKIIDQTRTTSVGIVVECNVTASIVWGAYPWPR